MRCDFMLVQRAINLEPILCLHQAIKEKLFDEWSWCYCSVVGSPNILYACWFTYMVIWLRHENVEIKCVVKRSICCCWRDYFLVVNKKLVCLFTVVVCWISFSWMWYKGVKRSNINSVYFFSHDILRYFWIQFLIDRLLFWCHCF